MLNPRVVYAMECDGCQTTIPDPKSGMVGWNLDGLPDAADEDGVDWYRDGEGRTFCQWCAGNMDGLTPIRSIGELCVECGLCHHPFPQAESHYIHHPNADGCGYCDELNADGVPLCEGCHRLLATLGYENSRWYWGDLEFAVDEQVDRILWHAVWAPGRITVGQAQDAWDYVTRTGDTAVMGAAGGEPADGFHGHWPTIGDFLDREGDAYARGRGRTLPRMEPPRRGMATETHGTPERMNRMNERKDHERIRQKRGAAGRAYARNAYAERVPKRAVRSLQGPKTVMLACEGMLMAVKAAGGAWGGPATAYFVRRGAGFCYLPHRDGGSPRHPAFMRPTGPTHREGRNDPGTTRRMTMVLDANGMGHEPAGTPHGGRFTRKAGAGAGADDLEPDYLERYRERRSRLEAAYDGYADDAVTRERVGRVAAALDALGDDHVPDDAQTAALAACADVLVSLNVGDGEDNTQELPLTAAQARAAIDWKHMHDDPVTLENLSYSDWNPDGDDYVLMGDWEDGLSGARVLNEDEYRAALWANRDRLARGALNVGDESEVPSDPRALDLMARAFA